MSTYSAALLLQISEMLEIELWNEEKLSRVMCELRDRGILSLGYRWDATGEVSDTFYKDIDLIKSSHEDLSEIGTLSPAIVSAVLRWKEETLFF